MFAVNVGGTVCTSTGLIAPGPRAPRRALHRRLRRHVRQRRVHVRHGDRGPGAQHDEPVILGGSLNEDLLIDEAAVYPKWMRTGEAAIHYDVGRGLTPQLTGHGHGRRRRDRRPRGRPRRVLRRRRRASTTTRTAPYTGTLDTLDALDPVYDGDAHDHDQGLRRRRPGDRVHGQASRSTTSRTPRAARTARGLRSAVEPPADGRGAGQGRRRGHGHEHERATWSATDVVLRPRWISPDATPEIVEQPEVSLGANLAAGAGDARVLVTFEPPALPDGRRAGPVHAARRPLRQVDRRVLRRPRATSRASTR